MQLQRLLKEYRLVLNTKQKGESVKDNCLYEIEIFAIYRKERKKEERQKKNVRTPCQRLTNIQYVRSVYKLASIVSFRATINGHKSCLIVSLLVFLF